MYMYMYVVHMYCTVTVYRGSQPIECGVSFAIGEYENIKDRIDSISLISRLSHFAYIHCTCIRTVALTLHSHKNSVFSLRLSSKVKNYCQEGMRLGIYSYYTPTNTN